MLLLAVTVAQEGVFDGTPTGGSTGVTDLEGMEPERTVPETTFAADEGPVMEEEPPAGTKSETSPRRGPKGPVDRAATTIVLPNRSPWRRTRVGVPTLLVGLPRKVTTAAGERRRSASAIRVGERPRWGIGRGRAHLRHGDEAGECC